MEALVLYLLLLLGLPVGGTTETPAADSGTTTSQKDKVKTKSSDGTITTLDGGTGTWDDNGIIKPIDPNNTIGK